MDKARNKSSEERTPYWNFLPRFSCLLEIGNWSQSWADRSLSIARAVAERYKLVLMNTNLPYSKKLRSIHERWWIAGTAGEVRVYRVTIQCKMSAVYKVRVSCDDDQEDFVQEYFAKTDHVINNTDDATKVAESIIIKIANMF